MAGQRCCLDPISPQRSGARFSTSGFPTSSAHRRTVRTAGHCPEASTRSRTPHAHRGPPHRRIPVCRSSCPRIRRASSHPSSWSAITQGVTIAISSVRSACTASVRNRGPGTRGSRPGTGTPVSPAPVAGDEAAHQERAAVARGEARAELPVQDGRRAGRADAGGEPRLARLPGVGEIHERDFINNGSALSSRPSLFRARVRRKLGVKAARLPDPPPEVGLIGARQRRRHQGFA